MQSKPMDSSEKIKKAWDGKFVILAVTGSIAAYKSAEILRRIQDQGAEIQVLLTKTASKFIAPETLKQLSGHKVLTDIFDDEDTWQMGHISLSDRAHAMLIAPATANILAKLAHGIADDLISSTALAFTKPIVIAPSMNDAMWNNPATQTNIKILLDRGVLMVPPGQGYLACHRIGTGRLADTEDILAGLGFALQEKKDLRGKKVLVSAGPTQESLDPVRFITNPSTGKMGFAVATAAYQRGADVTLVSGPTHLRAPFGVKLISVRTGEEMREAVLSEYPNSDIAIMTAAVSDFRPVSYSNHKIKKSKNGLELKLESTADILMELGQQKENKILVGFAAETQNLLENAKKKMKEKNLDIIAVNDISRPDIGFASDNNAVTLINSKEDSEHISPRSKQEIANILLDRIAGLTKRKKLTSVSR